MKKILYIILDGLGDQPIREISNKTPLEAASTLNLDRFAKDGSTGLVYPVAPGVAPESDIAVINLLGADADKFYTGRGPLEAFAEGLTVNKGDLALRANFATVEDDALTIKDRRVARDLTTEEAQQLSDDLNSKLSLSQGTFEFKSTIGHRAILVIRGIRSRLSGMITNTDPAYQRKTLFSQAREDFEDVVLESKPLPCEENCEEAKEAALLLNEFTQKSFKVLSESAVNKKRMARGALPANIILCRDAGDRLPEFPSIKSVFGLNFACFAQMPVERGIALLLGMPIVEVPAGTGHFDVDLSILAKMALNALKSNDAVYVHIKGPDEPAHDGDFRKKIEIIEAIDNFFFSQIAQGIDPENILLCVTSDHSTVCVKKAHTADPVPILVYSNGIKADRTAFFSEESVKGGSLGKLRGQEILPLLIKMSKA